MDYIATLDDILKLMVEYSKDTTMFISPKKLVDDYDLQIPYSLCYTATAKLYKDGYLERLFTKKEGVAQENRPNYHASYEGIIFNLEGGYSQKAMDKARERERLETSEKKTVRRENMLMVGAWLAGIGTLGLLIWQFFQFFCFSH